jgi:quercetin dioxygenase-like cupin family protein
MEVVPHESDEDVEAVPGVHLAQLAAGERMSVQHFVIEPGRVVPEHSHEHEQAGYLVSGVLVFEVDGERRRVEAGDSYVLPGEEPHAVENPGDEPAKGIDVFSPPRTNPDWQD